MVIDFETVTPAGHPAQPIEVAALALRYTDEAWHETDRASTLIQPPVFAPVTAANTAQSGLTREHFKQAPDPAEALGNLDRRFAAGNSYRLVAQHAATEANIIHHQREHCPTLAHIDFLDTIPLSKYLVPGLPNYKLDTLLTHFSIPLPPDRHRASADVHVTALLFKRLITVAGETSNLDDLGTLIKIAGRTARGNMPVQEELFDL